MKFNANISMLKTLRMKEIVFTCLREGALTKHKMSILEVKFQLTNGATSRLLGRIDSKLWAEKKEKILKKTVTLD